MGRSPCCDENGIKKGPWTTEEDEKLKKYIEIHGHGSWRALPKLAGLNRCGKSCRLRWTNYLRPDIKRGKFSEQEEQTILHWHSILGNKWSAIASYLPGRTDNEIKNYWNTHLKKKLIQMGFDPMTHKPRTDLFSSLPQLIALANLKELISQQQYHNPLNDHAMRLQTEALQLAKLQYLHQLLQPTTTATAQATSIGQYCQGLAGESAAQAAALNILCTALSPRENLEVLCSQPPPLHQQHLNQSPMLSQLSPDPQQVQVQEPLSFGYVPTTPLSSQLTQSFGNSLVSPFCQGGTNTNSNVNIQPGDDSYWGFPPEVPNAAPPATTETSISNHGGGSSTPTSCSGASPCAPDDWQDLFLGADQSLLLN